MGKFCFAASALFFLIAAVGPHNWPLFVIAGVAWFAVGLGYDE